MYITRMVSRRIQIAEIHWKHKDIVMHSFQPNSYNVQVVLRKEKKSLEKIFQVRYFSRRQSERELKLKYWLVPGRNLTLLIDYEGTKGTWKSSSIKTSKLIYSQDVCRDTENTDTTHHCQSPSGFRRTRISLSDWGSLTQTSVLHLHKDQ